MLLITGASGRIGRRVADLLAHGHGPLRLMSRTPERVLHSADVEIVLGDFARPDTLAAAFRGVGVALVISSSAPPGRRALHHRNAFIAAARAGVQHVVYLSLQGAGSTSKFAYSRDHDASEQFLREAGIPAYTILRNAFYLDMLPGFVDATGVLRDPAGRGRAAFLSREDAARAAAAALLDPPGGTFDVTGPEALSVADAVARLARLTGRALHGEVAVKPAPTNHRDDWRAELYTGWFEAIAAGEQTDVTTAVRRFTGREPLTLEAYFSAFPEALGALRKPA